MFTLQRTSRRLSFFLSFKIIIRKDFFFFLSLLLSFRSLSLLHVLCVCSLDDSPVGDQGHAATGSKSSKLGKKNLAQYSNLS